MASFYVQKRPTTKTGWRLMKEEYEGGRRSQKAVPKTAWFALGFSETMTLDQAKARVKELNGQNSITRQETLKITKIAERVERDRLYHSIFIPQDLNEQFLSFIEKNSSGGEAHLNRLKIHWTTTKKLLIALKLLPDQYVDNKKQIYRYLSTQEYSIDYAKKLLSMLNRYGSFVSRLRGKFYEPVPAPIGTDREMITDAYLDSDGYHGPSDGLTLSDLSHLRERLTPAQHAWISATVWFGLRPSELDAVLADRFQKIWRLEPGDPDTLWVYQPKLTSKPRDQRWKPIPILFNEQREALKTLMSGLADKPLTKTLQKYCDHYVTLYAGRKAFTDLMLDKGQKLEDISQWLGHTTIDMTWQRYKSKRKVRFTLVK